MASNGPTEREGSGDAIEVLFEQLLVLQRKGLRARLEIEIINSDPGTIVVRMGQEQQGVRHAKHMLRAAVRAAQATS